MQWANKRSRQIQPTDGIVDRRYPDCRFVWLTFFSPLVCRWPWDWFLGRQEMGSQRTKMVGRPRTKRNRRRRRRRCWWPPLGTASVSRPPLRLCQLMKPLCLRISKCGSIQKICRCGGSCFPYREFFQHFLRLFVVVFYYLSLLLSLFSYVWKLLCACIGFCVCIVVTTHTHTRTHYNSVFLLNRYYLITFTPFTSINFVYIWFLSHKKQNTRLYYYFTAVAVVVVVIVVVVSTGQLHFAFFDNSDIFVIAPWSSAPTWCWIRV